MTNFRYDYALEGLTQVHLNAYELWGDDWKDHPPSPRQIAYLFKHGFAFSNSISKGEAWVLIRDHKEAAA